MQKTMSLAKLNVTGKVHMTNVQTEELIADCRSVLTPHNALKRSWRLAPALHARSVDATKTVTRHAARASSSNRPSDTDRTALSGDGSAYLA